MRATGLPAAYKLAGTIHYQPAISIFIPFEPKMRRHSEITYELEGVIHELETSLAAICPADISLLMMKKLQALLAALDFTTYKRSVAIFLSPVYEKVFYLSLALQKKIMVRDTFSIRDIVSNRKPQDDSLVLVLGEQQSRVYVKSNDVFTQLVTHAPAGDGFITESPVLTKKKLFKTTGSPVSASRRYLQLLDQTLDIICRSYPFPLFAAGPAQLLRLFKKFAAHAAKTVAFIPGCRVTMGLQQLNEKMAPFVTDKKEIHQQYITRQLQEAAAAGKLLSGFSAVRQAALKNQGKFLVIENLFLDTLAYDGSEADIAAPPRPYNNFSPVRDMLDEVIEKVLENDGNIEFTDHLPLLNGSRIWLIIN